MPVEQDIAQASVLGFGCFFAGCAFLLAPLALMILVGGC